MSIHVLKLAATTDTFTYFAQLQVDGTKFVYADPVISFFALFLILHILSGIQYVYGGVAAGIAAATRPIPALLILVTAKAIQPLMVDWVFVAAFNLVIHAGLTSAWH